MRIVLILALNIYYQGNPVSSQPTQPRAALAAAIAIALTSQPIFAQAPNIEEIVVTAAGFEQKITDAPASISVITQEDILSRPHVNLLDMLKYQEGVDI